jgi:uncharacterized protein (TIGR02646 family)
MRNVSRVDAPNSFKLHAVKWRRQLADRMRKHGRATDYFYDLYNTRGATAVREDMKLSLIQMYNAMCCYCEGGSSKTNGEIEHLRPKKRFPDLAYDWNNLHWSCGACNHAKGELYDDENPILDPTDGEAIDRHISFLMDEETISIWLIDRDRSKRGHTTIEHADLNREDLRRARTRIYWKTLALIQRVRGGGLEAQRLRMIQESLKRMHHGDFGFATTVKSAFDVAHFRYEDLAR